MSLKGSRTVSAYIQWNEAQALILKLERDKNTRYALLVATGIYTGLRVGDILTLQWEQLDGQSFTVKEGKTGKTRTVTVNNDLRAIVARLRGLQSGLIFRIGRQQINRELKVIAFRYKIKGNISTHSLRKTFGRHVWEVNDCSDRALIMLSKIFNHTSTEVTRTYLGITSQEIADIYTSL